MTVLDLVSSVLELLSSIAAGVISTYVCKWLDGKRK